MLVTLLSSGRFFLIILAELIPLFLIVTFISGLLMEYISPETLRKSLAGRKGLLGQGIALGLGYVTPFCSCSTVPVLATMARAGIPIGVMTTFLLSSPYPVEIALPILAPLFGVRSALVFLTAGGLLALVFGTLAQRAGWQNQIKVASGPPRAADPSADGSALDLVLEDGFRAKAARAWDYTLGFARSLLPIVVISSAVGALIYGFVPEEIIVRYAGGAGLLAVPIAALIGVPLYVNAAAVVPIIYSLSLKGLSQGAVLAFLITATTISPPEILMLTKLFRKKYVIGFGLAMVLGAMCTGYAVNWIAH